MGAVGHAKHQFIASKATNINRSIHAKEYQRYLSSNWVISVDSVISFTLIFLLIGSGPVGFTMALAFLLTGLCYCLLKMPYTLAACKHNWPLLLYPVVATASVLWSEYPGASLRGGIQLILTYIICISLIYTINIKTILVSVVCATSLYMIASLINPKTIVQYSTGEIINVGIFQSKNNYALFTSVSGAFALFLLFHPQSTKPEKLIALFSFTLSLALFLQAKSLGTTISFFFCAIATSIIYPINRFLLHRHSRGTIYLYLAFMIAGLTLAFYILFTIISYESLMHSLGKDPTITGRTILWEIGWQYIKENPLFGLGLQAFWVESNLSAVHLWQVFQKDVGTTFGFHNLYIDTWVELGLLGMMSVLIVMFGILLKLIVRRGSSFTSTEFFTTFVFLLLFIKSPFEVVGFSQFSFITFIICLLWMIAFKSNYSYKGEIMLIKF